MANLSTYIVTISLSKSSLISGTYSAPYKAGGPNDTFSFMKTKIVISCDRSVKYQGDEPLENIQNTVHHQIKKALMMYQLTNMDNAYVNSIIIKRKTRTKIDLVTSRTYTRSNQPFIRMSAGVSVFPVGSAERVLNEDEAAIALRIIISHWIKGVAIGDVFLKYDSLWRSFERCAMYSNRNEPDPKIRIQERSALTQIRAILLANGNLYQTSWNIAQGLCYNDICILRWRECLNNESARKNTRLAGCNDYRSNFILNNNDNRIVQLQRNTFPVMKKKLHAENMDTLVWNDITSKVPIPNNAELIAVLLCKYAYFYRCRVFHGEMIAQPVYLPVSVNKEEERVSLLNRLLEAVVRDFITEFHTL